MGSVCLFELGHDLAEAFVTLALAECHPVLTDVSALGLLDEVEGVLGRHDDPSATAYNLFSPCGRFGFRLC